MKRPRGQNKILNKFIFAGISLLTDLFQRSKFSLLKVNLPELWQQWLTPRGEIKFSPFHFISFYYLITCWGDAFTLNVHTLLTWITKIKMQIQMTIELTPFLFHIRIHSCFSKWFECNQRLFEHWNGKATNLTI